MNISKGKAYDTFRVRTTSDNHEARLVQSLMLRPEADISDWINMSRDEVELLLAENEQKEKEIQQKIEAVLDEQDYFWARRLLLQKAIEYKNVLPVNHTGNQWRKDRHDDIETISNMVYRMWIRVSTTGTYAPETGMFKVDTWYVTWRLSYNSPIRENVQCIAKIDDKRFTDFEAMLKYIAGRKKAYAKFFTDISPAIPKDKARLFSVCGALLPGYTIEEGKT